MTPGRLFAFQGIDLILGQQTLPDNMLKGLGHFTQKALADMNSL